MHRDHYWSSVIYHRLRLRCMQFGQRQYIFDAFLILSNFFNVRVLQSAHGTWDSESGDSGFVIAIFLSLSLSLVFPRLPATLNSKRNTSVNAQLQLRRAIAWNMHDFPAFILPHRGPDQRHIRTSSALHYHSSRQTSVKPLSRRSPPSNFARQ